MGPRLLLFPLAALGLSITSCAGGNAGTQGASQALGGLATATAVAATIPLMPVAAIYNGVTVPRERREEEQLEQSEAPALLERTERIRKHDAKADARRAWSGGDRAFLPYAAGDSFYPGLEETGYPRDKAANSRTVKNSRLLSGFQELIKPQEHRSRNFSTAYREFIDVRGDYNRTFNQEILRLQKGR